MVLLRKAAGETERPPAGAGACRGTFCICGRGSMLTRRRGNAWLDAAITMLTA